MGKHFEDEIHSTLLKNIYNIQNVYIQSSVEFFRGQNIYF
jgi:hypothetical protein